MKGREAMSKTFLWIEDRQGKSGYIFWKTLMQQLCPEVVVESKKNNSELVKAVKSLSDMDNKYVIVFDNSFDNPQVAMELKLLKKSVDERDNVVLMDLICFEFILLEFKDLIKWIYASDDEFLEKRAVDIAARKKFVDSVAGGKLNYKDIREIIMYDCILENHNVEQVAARLLFSLTRNTGFEVSKGKIGDCWIKSCCEWTGRKENDVCGLDRQRLSVYQKMKCIYEGTSLKNQFLKAGLEVRCDYNI